MPYSGRKLSARSADNVEAFRVSVCQSPKKPIQRRSSELGVLWSSLHRILSKNLHLYPYRIQIKHKLMLKRVEMCNRFQTQLKEIQISLTVCGFAVRLTSCFLSTSTARIMCSGAQKHQKRCLRDHYTL